MTRLRAIAVSVSLAGAAILASGCGAGSHAALPTSSPGAAQSGPSTAPASTAGPTVTTPAVTPPAVTGADQAGQIAAIESDVSEAASAGSQAQTDVDAAAAAQAENDSP
jgi:hypothetical protein